MKAFLLLLVLGLAALVTACGFGINMTRGSGKIVTEPRQVSNFHRVNLTGAGELNITQGDTESLTIETDDNLMSLITTNVSDGTLVIGLDTTRGLTGLNPTRLVYTLNVKNFDSLQISGAGNVKAPAIKSDALTISTSGAGNLNFTGVDSKSLKVTISGAGNIVLAGQVETQEASLTGFGNYDGGNLKSSNTTVTLSGAGSATVWATQTLNARLSGAGGISYYGSPQVTQTISGVGAIKSLGNK